MINDLVPNPPSPFPPLLALMIVVLIVKLFLALRVSPPAHPATMPRCCFERFSEVFWSHLGAHGAREAMADEALRDAVGRRSGDATAAARGTCGRARRGDK